MPSPHDPRDALRQAQDEFASADAEMRRYDAATDSLVEVVARRRHDVDVANENRRMVAMTVAEAAALDVDAVIPLARVDDGELLHATSQLDLAIEAHRAATENLSVATRARGAAQARVRAAAAAVAVDHAEELARALDIAEREATELRIQLTGVINSLGGQGIQVSAFANEVGRRPPTDIFITNSQGQKRWQAIARRVRA